VLPKHLDEWWPRLTSRRIGGAKLHRRLSQQQPIHRRAGGGPYKPEPLTGIDGPLPDTGPETSPN